MCSVHKRSQGGVHGARASPNQNTTNDKKNYDNIAQRCLVAVFFFSNYSHNSN